MDGIPSPPHQYSNPIQFYTNLAGNSNRASRILQRLEEFWENIETGSRTGIDLKTDPILISSHLGSNRGRGWREKLNRLSEFSISGGEMNIEPNWRDGFCNIGLLGAMNSLFYSIKRTFRFSTKIKRLVMALNHHKKLIWVLNLRGDKLLYFCSCVKTMHSLIINRETLILPYH